MARLDSSVAHRLLSADDMLWTTFASTLLLWCAGVITSFTLGGYIHVLPIIAAVVALVGTIQRRSSLI
jgi:hypothetical protein